MSAPAPRAPGDDTLGAPWPTCAEPLAFAPPVEVRDDAATFTVAFDVFPRTEPELEVEVDGQTLVLFGAVRRCESGRAARLRRAFVLPDGVDGASARLRLEGRLLEVALAKRARRAIVVASP